MVFKTFAEWRKKQKRKILEATRQTTKAAMEACLANPTPKNMMATIKAGARDMVLVFNS